jgi:hypothetical protein
MKKKTEVYQASDYAALVGGKKGGRKATPKVEAQLDTSEEDEALSCVTINQKADFAVYNQAKGYIEFVPKGTTTPYRLTVKKVVK